MAGTTIYGDADTFLREWQPDTVMGNLTTITVGHAAKVDEESRALLRSDFSALIASGSTIDSAALYMYIYAVGGETDGEYFGERVRTEGRDWVELQATWNIYKTGNNWTTAGCYNGLSDVDSSVGFGPWSVVDEDEGDWVSVDVKTFLQDALDNRSGVFDACLDLHIALAEGESSEHMFYARQMSVPERRWYIAVTYTPPTGALIKKISGVDWANVKKVSGVAEASISRVSEVSAN